ncbi:MAG TPA: bifunctional demethylmenaquinone methyltransferase/2-methoxy-6-polyprenyl-1,4-benzoquinol methylase UbiE [Pyrinomonadaceae bacterium]|nr:bifunctional demethylmenaquinone methyltransferase/2-methoxy-6-polyprenyl-1,4-benzoquinol methylase UbiE [Pyrinomonadaceae bacterium]
MSRNPPSADASREEHARRVRAMFSGIARRYDLLNHLLSGNIDKRWRRRTARALESSLTEGALVLDVACGTGDLSLVLAEAGAVRVVGLDFCRPMLEIARRKAEGGARAIPFVEGDALRLPFADETFDAATIAFGLRNLAGVADGLRELRRILKPGGRLAVLEFSSPVVPGFRALFRFYFTRVLPRIGGLVSGSRGAYEYLPDSVTRFPDQKRLAELMRAEGFEGVEYSNLTGGIAALHTGTRAG